MTGTLIVKFYTQRPTVGYHVINTHILNPNTITMYPQTIFLLFADFLTKYYVENTILYTYIIQRRIGITYFNFKVTDMKQ